MLIHKLYFKKVARNFNNKNYGNSNYGNDSNAY